jgi:putative integral membrane protein (TIGR02587 family)
MTAGKASGRGTKRSMSHRKVAQSLQEYARGVAGGLLFSLPLLYTMEVWWAGFSSHPFRLVLYVLTTFILLLGYNFYAGLRHDASWEEVVIDSVEEMGLGLLISAGMLYLLGRITSEMTAGEIIGKIVIEAMTVAIGVSVGTAQLGGGGEAGADTGAQSGGGRRAPQTRAAKGQGKDDVHFGGQVVIAICGAVLFAANVAPTEEIIIIATETSTWKLFGLALLSLALGALILFYSDFTGALMFAPTKGHRGVVIGAFITYAIALASSSMILWFFGRFEGQSLITCLAQIVVLGLAATLGASAGRLLLQTR